MPFGRCLRVLVTVALLATGAVSLAQSAAPKPLRILFVGNSLTSTNDIPGRVAKVARALGRGATIESVTHPTYSLEDHWNDGGAAVAIAKGWDVVVLQQGPSTRDQERAQL